MTTLKRYQEAKRVIAGQGLINGLECLDLLINELKEDLKSSKKNPLLRRNTPEPIGTSGLSFDEVKGRIKDIKSVVGDVEEEVAKITWREVKP